ncbi:MAG: hypothetical protein HeimC2_20390 [Candidatus Heimdallarchaeota archaeon LC_2]|nr:MAG: hypothetical protein HeimC2_20390 [Candidatus Heimdallarchaeota archaeon LC_2]
MGEYEICPVCEKHANKEFTVTTNSILSLGRPSQRTKTKYYCSKGCRYYESWQNELYVTIEFFFIGFLILIVGLWLIAALLFAIGSMFFIYANWKRTYRSREMDSPQVPEEMWVAKNVEPSNQ